MTYVARSRHTQRGKETRDEIEKRGAHTFNKLFGTQCVLLHHVTVASLEVWRTLCGCTVWVFSSRFAVHSPTKHTLRRWT